MIVREESGRVLVDAEALAVMLARALPTIRKHCTVVATDVNTGRQLYDQTAAVEAMRHVRQRTPARRVKRR